MAIKSEKPLFDISTYEEQKKRAAMELNDLLEKQNHYMENYEKARKASIGYLIAMLVSLLLMGVLQQVIPHVSTGVGMGITIFKIGLIIVVLWSSIILFKYAPECVVTKYDGTWYRYPILFKKLDQDIKMVRARLNSAEETLQKAQSVHTSVVSDATPEPAAMEDGSMFGRQEAFLEENEEGDLVISMEDALKSLEEEDV